MIISILNQKGGVGKTTIAINLAYGLSIMDIGEVLLVNADPQATIRDWGIKSEGKYLTMIELNNKSIEHQIHKHKKNYDWIIVDGVGNLEDLTKATGRSSDFILIPTLCSQAAMWATEPVVDFLVRLREANSSSIPPIKGPEVAFVLNRVVKSRTRALKKAEALMAEENRFPTLKSHISERFSYDESIGEGKTIFQWNDKKAKEEFMSFILELKEIIYAIK